MFEKRNFLESEIDKIIFIDHSGVAIDLVKSSNVCRFKYSDGLSLIDKLYVAFKDSIVKKDSNVFYYRKLVFDVLTNGYSYSKKIDNIIDDLGSFYKNKFDKVGRDIIMCLIIELEIYKHQINRERVSDREKELLRKFFDIKDNFSRFIEKPHDLFYPYVGVSKSRSKGIITIDSMANGSNVSYDDAISIRKTHYGYLLGIYITDVASYVCDNTMLYEHAFQRGESIYTRVDKNMSCKQNRCFQVPMFPDCTRNFFSLNNGFYRKVVGHFFELSDDFSLISGYIKPIKVKISKNYSFDDVDRISMDDSNYDMIYLLLKFADKFKSQFNLGYHSIKEQKWGKNSFSSSIGSRIVEISSLFLNSYIAQIMSENNYPFIYRVNESVLYNGLLDRSIYSSSDLGHIVNNGNCYGHVTNPIRSFAALLNQYFELNLLVFNGNKDEFISKWNCELPNIVDKLNTRLFLNGEYKDAIEKIFGKQLTRKK